MGNICRSPTAEGVMRRLLADRGLTDRIEVDSAGTTAYHVGDPPDARMRQAAASRGYRLDGQARRATADDFARFDLIVAMDRDNLADLLALAARRGRGAGVAGGAGRRADGNTGGGRTDHGGDGADGEADAASRSGPGRAELRLFSDFLPAGAPPDVPDPYYGGERGFETVLDLIEQASPAILDHLLGPHSEAAGLRAGRHARAAKSGSRGDRERPGRSPAASGRRDFSPLPPPRRTKR
jgi:low molecular weight protein-tyrosine phosphatase